MVSKVWNPTVKLAVVIMMATLLISMVVYRFWGERAEQSDISQDQGEVDLLPPNSENAVVHRGGNRAMMEKNAKSLIEINEAILEDLRVNHRNGEIRLVATVTGQDSERVIRVERFEQIGDASNSQSPNPVMADHNIETDVKHGAATIRFGPIPDYSRSSFAGPQQPTIIKTEKLPVAENEQRHRIESLLNEHPNLKLVEIDSESVRQLPDLHFLPPAGGAAILYW
jgi:hypothetical protein